MLYQIFSIHNTTKCFISSSVLTAWILSTSSPIRDTRSYTSEDVNTTGQRSQRHSEFSSSGETGNWVPPQDAAPLKIVGLEWEMQGLIKISSVWNKLTHFDEKTGVNMTPVTVRVVQCRMVIRQDMYLGWWHNGNIKSLIRQIQGKIYIRPKHG